jgi:hypothetical protein
MQRSDEAFIRCNHIGVEEPFDINRYRVEEPMSETPQLKDPVNTMIRVERMLRSGALQHSDEAEAGPSFNMSSSCMGQGCGTVACIGGWLWLVENPRDYSGANSYVAQVAGPLHDLFYPPNMASYAHITAEEAADALHNYRLYGEPRWDQVMS